MAWAQARVIPDDAAVRSRTRPSETRLPILALKACDCVFAIECPDDDTAAVVDAAFGALLLPSTAKRSAVSSSLRIEPGGHGCGYRVHRVHAGATRVADTDALLFHIDKWLTIALQ